MFGAFRRNLKINLNPHSAVRSKDIEPSIVFIQANKYKHLIGETIRGQKIYGITFYFSSKPPSEIIRALERSGVKVDWVK